MHVLLLALHQPDEPAPGTALERAWRCEQAHALAVMRFLSEELSPLLVCRPDAPVHRQALAAQLPFVPVESDGAWMALRLWWRMRQYKQLLICTMGQAGLGLACRLKRLRACLGPRATQCAHIFLLTPPQLLPQDFGLLRQARHIIYGSNYVRMQVETALGRANEQPALASLPETALTPLTPGAAWEGTDSHPDDPQPNDAHPNDALLASPWQSGRFIVGMAGALGEQSGVRHTLAALARVAGDPTLPPVELRLLGHGPRYREVLDAATLLGLDRCLAILDEQNMAEVLPLCHAWLAPGHAPDEAPETLACAFAAGLPVLAANGALHRERLDGHPNAALLVQENDSEAWAKALRRLMLEPDLRATLAAGGRALWPTLALESAAQQLCEQLAAWCHDNDWQEKTA